MPGSGVLVVLDVGGGQIFEVCYWAHCHPILLPNGAIVVADATRLAKVGIAVPE
jgi:hypothetical protein